MRQEYIDHLMRNDYILCPRGGGNYSHRVYETMAAGRIPVLIDTDLVMPFPDVIPWQEISVWVPLADIDGSMNTLLISTKNSVNRGIVTFRFIFATSTRNTYQLKAPLATLNHFLPRASEKSVCCTIER